ncbi:MAG TPA: homoserine dehydrogenase [Candidatus Saccharimonadales bacterium]|nr:homoserine dehydrogenase [Candidatus Saccharimonadales bacterium]
MESVGVGLLGLGTVGSAVAARLIEEWDLLGERAGATPVLRCAAVRDTSRTREVDLKNVRVLDDAQAVVDDPGVSIVIEAIGGSDPATALIESALRAGKSVVTANKAVIAVSGPRLADVAAANHAGLYFEAAVGAGLPIVSLLSTSLLGDRITGLDCVINGTTNVILTKMRAGKLTFDAALSDAQARGFAEADPTLDVDGWDAAHKLVILSWLAMGMHIETGSVDRAGIRGVGAEDVRALDQLGYRVRLVAHAERARSGRVRLSVRPTAVGARHLLGDVDDADNAVIISSDLASRVMLRGLGAGGASTASAVVSDVVNAVRDRNSPRGHAPRAAQTAALLDDEDVDVAGYVRLRLTPASEGRDLVLQALEDRGLAVDAAVELPNAGLIVLTGTAPRAVHERAMETLDTLTAVEEIECTLDRVEA